MIMAVLLRSELKKGCIKKIHIIQIGITIIKSDMSNRPYEVDVVETEVIVDTPFGEVVETREDVIVDRPYEVDVVETEVIVDTPFGEVVETREDVIV